MKTYILVADLGSSKTELVLYDRMLAVLDSTDFRTPFEEHDGVRTIDPRQYTEDLLDAADRLAVPLGSGDALYVSTTGMGSTVLAAAPVAASKRGGAGGPQALTPVLGWETALKEAAPPAGGWSTIPLEATGKMPLPTYPLFKIPELRRRLAESRDGHAAVCFVSLHDYVWASLAGGGRFHTDFSLASRSLLFDDVRCRWDTRILAALGLAESEVPSAVPAGTVLGSVRPEVRRSLGWPAASFVFAGMHDHAATTLTGLRLAGAIRGGLTCGIWVNPAGTTESLTSVAEPGADWMQALVGGAPQLRLNTARVWDEGGCALVCYPCLSGPVLRTAAEYGIGFDACLRTLGRITATPPRRRLMAGDPGFVKIHGNHEAPFPDIAAARAVGVQYELRAGMEDMQALLGEVGGGLATTGCREIFCLGGQARTPWLGRLKAAVLNRPVHVLAGENCAALGVALRFVEYTARRRRAGVRRRIARLALSMQRHDPERESALRFEAAYREYHRVVAAWRERE
jgi:sugar (pentulose or hexulose) kinase